MLCIDSMAPCTGCGRCRSYPLICSVCSLPIADSEKYYLLFGRPVCGACAREKGNGEASCLLCGEDARGGIEYKKISFCPTCASRLGRYAGYC